MAAIKSKYKRFNGVAWEEYYFETSADQVIGLVDFIKNNETKLSTNDSTATSGKYISRIQVSDHGLTITKADLPTGFSGDYNDLINKPDLALKLDKNFSALPTQASPLLTDVLVINRGAVVQKVTLGNVLAQVDNEIFVVVTTLPTTGVVNKIYLLPKGTPGSQDGYDEYIWVNGAWEKLGTITLDLSNIYNKTEVNGLLSAKVNKNNAITAGTKAKITYDSKGLVTSGADLVATDIPNLDAAKITTGTFIEARIPSLNPAKITQNSTNRFVTDTEKLTWSGKQNTLTAGDGINIAGNVISSTNKGYEPDGESIKLNSNNELEATNVAIWRYE